MGMITIHTTEYYVWQDDEDEPREKDSWSEDFDPEDYREDLGDYDENAGFDDDGEWHGDWIPATTVAAAIELLTGHGCNFYASECSASPTDGVNVWYIEETEIHPYTDERTEKTAHLYGFTEDEQRAIYNGVFDR
jgi:hypothetical protein